MTTPATGTSAKSAVQAAFNGVSTEAIVPRSSTESLQIHPKVDSRTHPKVVPETSTPTASKDKAKSFTSPANLVAPSPHIVPSSDASAKAPFWYSYADCVQALAKADSTAKVPSSSAKTKAVQNAERLKLRLAAKKIVAAKKQAKEDVQWDIIDLSDDEEWDKVAVDEGAEWDMLEE